MKTIIEVKDGVVIAIHSNNPDSQILIRYHDFKEELQLSEVYSPDTIFPNGDAHLLFDNSKIISSQLKDLNF